MNCKIIEKVLKDRKVIIGEKIERDGEREREKEREIVRERERNMIKKYKNRRNEETTDRG